MKVIRAHDYSSQPADTEPDFKGLRRLFAGFIAVALICFFITMRVVIRTVGTNPLPRAITAHSCMCPASCSRAR
jgi:hypothetical protein